MSDPAGLLPEGAGDPASPLAELADLLTRRGFGSPGQRALEELADLSVAQEELRVAEAELAAQHEQIRAMLHRHEEERHWRTRLAALVPIGLCATDGTGRLVDVNPAFAEALGVAPHRLHGKPLSVYLDPADVPALRAAVRDLRTGHATERRLTVTITGRTGRPARHHLLGFADRVHDRPADARLQWVLGDPAPSEGPGEVSAGGAASPGESESLATALSELAALGLAEADRQRLLGRMAAVVRSAVPAADWVSLTIGAPASPRWQGSESPEAQAFDGAQLRAEDGPCWEAYATGSAVVTEDVTADGRWPRLRRIVAEGPVRSVLAVPVSAGGEHAGVLNLYARAGAAFGAPDRRLTTLVAGAVAGVLESVMERQALRDLAANLERALSTRAVIDQAKGVLMARLGVDADDAFARMVTLSNRLNVKVRDLATLVVQGHADEVIAAG
ncbi:ANTAR domain-containing protein [Blastococcus sp. TF02A-26]|uniref:ANTAR domain-containing protein n=1 Tax=Blastococcus sp. TF02A-26 TaxID=2250577 RepID=UPI000DE94256|nr:ANTAR domain-containing protein [Blastococcus sp. TF02A-26]RBY90829.1 hypothetical protein DQ240_01925 [Blastococcus sp. TF02A-26]